MDLDLAGKSAIVAASSKGPGMACALALAAEGARVTSCARSEAELGTTAPAWAGAVYQVDGGSVASIV
jgi:3-oxoacyl-[acyl-carrier protein] reductase